MIHSVLIGILFLGVIIIAYFLYEEKRRGVEREESWKRNLSDASEEIIKQYSAADKSLSDYFEKKTDTQINNEKAEIKRIEECIEKAINEAESNLAKTSFDIDTKLIKMEQSYDERSKLISDDITERISLLVKVVEQVAAENAELRKKLEFFTEIDEDSKKLNEKEDIEARENLIQKALSELSLKKEDNQSNRQTVYLETKNTEAEEVKDEAIVPNTSVTEVSVTDAPSILDDEQKLAFHIMNTTNENLFITGKAGTGKSFLLDVFVRGTSKKTIKLAPTGIAAINIGGATLHSTFGYDNLENLDVDKINASTIRLKSEKIHILKEIDTIIIDEISMVRADIFDKIDKILRVLNKSAKPFGGKQMIVFGDLFQLPPVGKSQEKKYLIDYYGGFFFFNSNAYSNGQFGFIELTINHRQKEDRLFFDILNRMREGRTTESDISNLNKRYVNDRRELRRILTLFPKKADAERLNKEELKKIEAKEYTYKARIVYNATNNQNPNLDAVFPITDELHLKRGALVMMVANDPDRRWVNGTMGVLHSLTENSIHVTIDGTTYEVKQCSFEEKEAVYSEGRIEYRNILCVEQFPVVLAYAITIHKSQGMTYKRIACDISQCFAPGQAYVALSRCSNLSGLYLLKPIEKSMMKVDKDVMDYYLSMSTEKTLQKFS